MTAYKGLDVKFWAFLIQHDGAVVKLCILEEWRLLGCYSVWLM
jgi:hypothetical protein